MLATGVGETPSFNAPRTAAFFGWGSEKYVIGAVIWFARTLDALAGVAHANMVRNP